MRADRASVNFSSSAQAPNQQIDHFIMWPCNPKQLVNYFYTRQVHLHGYLRQVAQFELNEIQHLIHEYVVHVDIIIHAENTPLFIQYDIP